MEATITPTNTRQILRTATAVTLGAAIGALFTIGINAVLTGDDSSETRAARGPRSPVTTCPPRPTPPSTG